MLPYLSPYLNNWLDCGPDRLGLSLTGPLPFERLRQRAMSLGRQAAHRGWYQAARACFLLARGKGATDLAARRYALHCAHAVGAGAAPLEFVVLGTTGLCNASCIHCPTGKAATAQVPRTPMPMDTFERIVRGIAEQRRIITGHLAFGLFGDGLVDPFVNQRAQMVRQYLPDVRLVINTNGAAFDRQRHAPLVDLIDAVTLHCESLDLETYNHLMQPLRLENVLPKLEQVLRTFPVVQVSIPASRANFPHLHSTAEWFRERGAVDIHFDPLASRCAEDTEVFDRLAFQPQPIACKPDALKSLIIDCDGKVLACCQDFQRLHPIGDLQLQELREALADHRRTDLQEIFAEGRHAEVETCSRCRGDIRTPDFPFDTCVG